MTIDKLGPINPVSKFNKPNKTQKAVAKDTSDSINISDDAKSLAEVYKAAEEVKKTEDIRMDRVNEVKKKLEDPSYIDDTVVDSVAENIMELFGL